MKAEEEPKQETHICKYCNAETTQSDDECYAKPKQETLEEVAERLIFKTIGGNYGIMSSDENDQVDGYYNTYEEAYLTLKLKWQAERMYSEGDIMNALHSVEVKHNKDYSKIWNSIKEFLNN